jgi:hypothetical protein
MLRRGFLSLFSLLFARPTAALVKPMPPGTGSTGVVPRSLQMGEIFPVHFDIPQVIEFDEFYAGERPVYVPVQLAPSCRQHKEGSLNA